MKIAYFAPIYFNDLKQRPQHIAELLSLDHEVYYIEPTISLMRYVLKGGVSYKGIRKQITPNLKVVRANGFLTGHISLQAVDILHLNVLSELIQLHGILEECDVIWIGYPGWYDLIRRYIGKKRLIYDKMDDHVSMAYNELLRKLMLRVEPKLIEASDEITVTCDVFYHQLEKYQNKVHLVRNAVPKELCHFQCQQKKVQNEGRVYGYFGTVGDWFDEGAIKTILAENENNRIIIVGKTLTEKMSDSRIEYVEQVPKEELCQYVQKFDVCIYPFKKNEFLDTINPVKLYEYLAFNKPVIAVESKETIPLAKWCNLYQNYDELRQLCSLELPLPFYEQREYDNFLAANCWEERLKHINNILSSDNREKGM